jgi:hypothetical protein
MARKNSGKATKAVAAQVKPVANNTSAAASRGVRKARDWAAPQVERTGQVIQGTVAPAASRGVRKARAWAAPQVERTGQVIQDTVAPKVADALAASARRIDPGKPQRRRWRILAGIAALLAAAAGAIAATQRNRTSPTATTAADEEEPTPAAEQASADGAKNPARTS